MNTQIQFLRIIATIAVVLFHALGYYTYGWPFEGSKVYVYGEFDKVINQINMPLFVTMSAYLYSTKIRNGKYKDDKKFIRDKARRLLLPYLFWSLLQIAVFPSTTSWNMLFSGCLHLWFLLMMFDFFFLTKIGKPIWKKTGLYIIILLSLFIKLTPQLQIFFSNILCCSALFNYSLFWIIGIWSSQRRRVIPLGMTFVMLIIGILLLVIFTSFIREYIFISSFCCTLGSVLIILALLLSNLDKISKLVMKFSFAELIDKNSMGIYIIHHIIIWWFVQLAFVKPFLDQSRIIAPLLMFAIALLFSIAITSLIRNVPYFRWMIGEK